MMLRSKKIYLLLFACVFSLILLYLEGNVFAQRNSNLSNYKKAGVNKQNIKVATKVTVPFSFLSAENKWEGFSIDLWEKISDRLNVNYTFIQVGSVNELLDFVEQEKADLAISAITITSEREKKVDFTHSYFEAGLQIMVKNGSGYAGAKVVAILEKLIAGKFLNLMFIVVLILFLIGHLVWIIERRKEDSDFRSKYPWGMLDGVWWAIVTVTTVGYGDKVPRIWASKLIGVLWMFLSLFLISMFTATITTLLTVEQLQGEIKGPNDLQGKIVAAPKGTTAEKYLNKINAQVYLVNNIKEAYELLAKDKVQAIVYDAPVLQYYLKNNKKYKFFLVEPAFNQENYGIALNFKGSLREKINRTILRLREDGTYRKIYNKWFKSD